MLDLNKYEPDFFLEFKRKNKPKRYTEDCDDYQLRNALRTSMLHEQNSQCFYCEKKIENNSRKVHIDHIIQRSINHHLECDYNNMVLSCNGDGEKYCAKYKDKQSIWDDNKFLRLLSDNQDLREKPSEVFVYMSSGKIKPKNALSDELKDRTKNTINYLNLNHKDLIGARRNIFLALKSYEEQGLNKKEIFTYFNEFENIFK